MTIVRNTLSDPGQAATVNRPITVRLASAGFRPGDESQIVSTATVRSDAAGSYELDLVPNSQIDPAGTHYVITHPDGTLWPIVVPDGSGPFWLRDILVEDPAAPGAVIAGLSEQRASVLLAPKLDAADLAVSVAAEIDTPGSAVDLSLRAAYVPRAAIAALSGTYASIEPIAQVALDVTQSGGSTAVPVINGEGAAFGSTPPFRARLRLDNIRASNAAAALSITTYVGGTNALVEPSVYFNPKGYGRDANGNAWPYWLTAGPYNGGDAQYENSSVWVSNDGLNWVVPPGGSNPVVAKPQIGNNCDPQIFEFNGVMYLTWTEQNVSGQGDTVKGKTTTDGITWSAPFTILSTPNSGHQALSTRFAWDGQQWHSWALDTSVAAPYRILHRTTINTLTSGPAWSSAVVVTGLTDHVSGAQTLWEYEVKRVGDEWWMMLNDAGTGAGRLYFATSTDAVTWVIQPLPVLSPSATGWDRSLYKGSFAPMFDGAEWKIAIWYAGHDTAGDGDWHIGYTTATVRPRSNLYKSGMYYCIPNGATATRAPANGEICASPAFFDAPTLLTSLGVEVITAGAAGSVTRLAIYADNGGVPGLLLLGAGTVATSATGVVDTAVNFTVSGLVWFAAVPQGTPATNPVFRVTAGQPIVPIGYGAAQVVSQTALAGYKAVSVTAALPKAFPAMDGLAMPVRVHFLAG